MEFFENKKSIRKVGYEDYIIGSKPLEPLLRISEKGLEVDNVYAKSVFINNVNVMEYLSGMSGYFHEQIHSISGFVNEEISGINNKVSTELSGISGFVYNQISEISGFVEKNKGSKASDRYELEEAFEIDSQGDVVPTNHPYISDTAWILKNKTDLELRANIWRYNIGSGIYTDDISF